MSEPLLLRNARYLHPTYGELAFVRAYNYNGRRYKFRTVHGPCLEMNLTLADTDALTMAPKTLESMPCTTL